MISDWQSADRFVIDQLIRPMANLYRISTDGTPVAFVRQKKLAVKEDIRFYADEGQTEELFRIKARSLMEFSSRYDVTTPGRGEDRRPRQGVRQVALPLDLVDHERGGAAGRRSRRSARSRSR